MSDTNRLQRLFLYHIWACVPFGLVWLVCPRTVAVTRLAGEILALRIVLVVAGVYVLARSWLVFRSPSSERFRYVWPVADVLLITAALFCKRFPADSWLVLLYLLPVTEAAATLSVRWALSVGALAAVGYLGSSGISGLVGLRYTYAAFRLSFLVLMASLLTGLGRELARRHRDLALAEYRNELAAEMHDGIQQYLAAISMRLELARSMIPSDPSEAARLAVDQQHVARQAADELRLMVRQLRSPTLEEHSLADRLRQCIALFGERCSLTPELRVAGQEKRLSPRVQHTVVRIVQEALNNVAKHAQARRVVVELEFEAHEVRCKVTDDGVGFDAARLPAQQTLTSGLGMQTMQRRAAELGGRCEVVSEPGRGTTVAVTFPYKPGSGGTRVKR